MAKQLVPGSDAAVAEGDVTSFKRLAVGGGTTIQKIIAGTANLSSGAATVSDSSVTANSIILLTAEDGTLNVGNLYVASRIAGTSFTMNSSNVLDARTVGYLIIEP